MTASMLNKELARLVSSAGLPKSYHTLHDLRRGGYMLAFEAGVPRELRKHHGDWRSDAELLYLRPSVEQGLSVPAAMRRLILQRT
ncbi:Hypp6501 [Branchiostoma lanceolatum]|uniref:Hypp6501 protein n=1 Tax=Branchiostoma lanceolatum TaxID=7740 RepID=A0A8J9YUZ6_BRALA|nr:Hypp6501 [Branchiostoma lanceolatum]